MKVFLSWSGHESKRIAKKFHSWLPRLIPGVEGFLSEIDIPSGHQWNLQIYQHLAECEFGILFLTHQNLKAPWIQFEAGALHVATAQNRVSPFLCGLVPSDIGDTPLSQFQCTSPTRDSILKLIQTINSIKSEYVEKEEHLVSRFNELWPNLDRELDQFRSSLGAELQVHDTISAGLTSFLNLANPIGKLSIFALNTQTIVTAIEAVKNVKIASSRLLITSAYATHCLYDAKGQKIAGSSEDAKNAIFDGRKGALDTWRSRFSGLGEKSEVRYWYSFPSQYTLIADSRIALVGLYRFEESKRRHGLVPGETILATSDNSNGYVRQVVGWFNEMWDRASTCDIGTEELKKI